MPGIWEETMKIRDYKYTPEDVDCRYCTKFIQGRCRANGCPWLNERIETGVIGYAEALDETFLEFAPLRRRVKLVSACSHSFWKDEQHRQRFAAAQAIFGIYRKRNTPAYYAALYLLTSDDSLFRRTAGGLSAAPSMAAVCFWSLPFPVSTTG